MPFSKLTNATHGTDPRPAHDQHKSDIFHLSIISIPCFKSTHPPYSCQFRKLAPPSPTITRDINHSSCLTILCLEETALLPDLPLPRTLWQMCGSIAFLVSVAGTRQCRSKAISLYHSSHFGKALGVFTLIFCYLSQRPLSARHSCDMKLIDAT